jgi:hypothetical protein
MEEADGKLQVREFIATKVNPGDVVILRCSERLTQEVMSLLRAEFETAEKNTGVKFILLDNMLSVEAVKSP